MGLRGLLARGGDRDPAGARRAPARGGRRCCTGTRIRTDPHMKAIVMGVHVVDVLVRPVEAIPEGQGGQLVDEIRVTPAGTAGGTAVTLAKLGAQVSCAGAIGGDALGDVLLELLHR